MSTKTFFERQIMHMRKGGRAAFFSKIKRLPSYLLAIPFVIVIRLIRPVLLVRFGKMRSERIGHFALNTEWYLCERDAGINVPSSWYVDIFFYGPPVSNMQLAKMWKRVLRVWPAWLMTPLYDVNRMIPGGTAHDVGINAPHNGPDVHGLQGRFLPHLTFSPEEKIRGEAGLRLLGIPPHTPFVCLAVRDSAYLDAYLPEADWSYHNHRDSDIQNYMLAAEELAHRGYFVIRMGAKVREAIKSSHPRIIDYATNGTRSDFMDMYLGAKCTFCFSSSTGFDTIPIIFRRPVAYVNMVPLGYLQTYCAQSIGITKHHFAARENRELTLEDIFVCGAGFYDRASQYKDNGIQLIENTPEEIRDVAVEMMKRLIGQCQPRSHDDELQARFWPIFPIDARTPDGKHPLHGKVHLRYGASFLRNNRWWLEISRKS